MLIYTYFNQQGKTIGDSSFANEQIYVLSQDNPELKGMGTTCTALLQRDDNVYIAHVGDSRIYLNTDNKLYRVTKDHSFVQKLVDAGQLSDSEMETHPRKNELTRALGISIEVEVEVSEKPLIVKNGDKFLMCSDGLCGLVNDPTISNAINKEKGFDGEKYIRIQKEKILERMTKFNGRLYLEIGGKFMHDAHASRVLP